MSAASCASRSIYLPNGNPPETDKYTYKLAWMDRLIAHARDASGAGGAAGPRRRLQCHPRAARLRRPAAWIGDALFLPQTRARFRTLLNLGLTDALRATTDEAGLYTFWDYQAGAWQRNKGIRIDHLLLSPQAADRLVKTTIDKALRGEDKPSDHVPVRIELA